ncbi:hypothetical protein EDB92DRAFT_270004 [Lactarius akahatsu]|uniref:Uncharacterized protein n=1 Tax=Lactarius akahatsu TaxID=416441 RepID=A0AAD4L538_9AGAM|nr:hypothetical protein EDB92DRAFT_270004 [Lactarius akahatsu]
MCRKTTTTVQAKNNYLAWQFLSYETTLTKGTKSSVLTRLASGWLKGPLLGSVSAPMNTLDSPDDNSSVGLATFNPFKTGGAQSHGRPASLNERREGCRILLEDFLDVGELKLDQRLRGIQLRSMRDCIRGAAWSDSELYAFEYDSKRLIINSSGTTSEGLRDVTWLGWDMYCAVYSGVYETDTRCPD